ncbi:MAG: Fic family protein, partial [Alphaproteobacteria bacterium]
MDAAQFRTSSSGKVIRTVRGAYAFVPNPLPPRLLLEPLVGVIADASQRLGELAGIGHGLANPLLVIAPFQQREAVASSRIEGTSATLADVMSAEAGGRADRRPADTREVQNYVKALAYAVARLPKLPLSLRLVREIHAILLGGAGPEGRAGVSAGAFRRVQNWIGGATPATARFVPPPVPDMMRALDSFERYLHARPRLPIVVDAALMHYQFEAIHPFPDGNGRVGRILIPLFLVMRGALPAPLLYLSPFFERNR